MRLIAGLLIATIVFAAAPPPGRAGEPVDLELVIATDVSYSIDQEEARLQREGVANAFLSRDVTQAIRSGILGRIAVAYIDFASTPFNIRVLDWRVIANEADAAAFARDLLAQPINRGRHTSISSALMMGAEMIEKNAFDGTRRVIDVSGDGPNNFEGRVDAVRDSVIARRISINGLPIINAADRFNQRYYLPDLDRYFEGCVIGGPGAFVVAATDFRDFARAIKKKLVLEIAGRMPDQPARIMKARMRKAQADGSLTGRAYDKGCDIGERIRYGAWGPDEP